MKVLLSYYMKKLIRTTITIPENLYRQAKVNAAFLRESFSAYVVSSLEQKVTGNSLTKKGKKIDPMKTLGVFSLGVKKIPDREKLYDKYLKRKMGI